MQNLTSLELLEIRSCEEVDLFTDDDDGTQCVSVTTLQHLIISEVPLTTSPVGISDLTSLQQLEIDRCPYLISLPDGISNLTSLQKLGIYKCTNLKSLPEGIHRLSSL